MTPLAASIVKQRLLAPGQRTVKDAGKIIEMMDDIHCFEVSEVAVLARRLLDKMLDQDDDPAQTLVGMTSDVSFLPAQKTWIEFKKDQETGDRVGYLLFQRNSRDDHALAFMVLLREGEIVSKMPVGIGLGVHGGSVLEIRTLDAHRFLQKSPEARYVVWFLQILLAMINTPKIIGRTLHMPNLALEKKLRRSAKFGVQFPLHAWTEIKLNIAKPIEIDDGLPHEAHLTGARALHFCRAHLRIKNGKIEFVTHHWRGNAAHGVRNSRYRLVSEPA